MKIRTRIAPSPTGYPHIGTIWQALINFAFAKKNKGKFVVRIEDTDRKRLIPDAEKRLFEALNWFGLTPDESPVQKGKFGPYRQSERLALYQKYAQELVKKGKAYYCFCSPQRLEKVRQKMKQQGKIPMYDGHCRSIGRLEAEKRIKAGEKYVIRLKVPKDKTIIVNDLLRGKIEFDSNLIDDQVLLKSDGFPTYQLAVVVDDHLMEITHMVRGEEWISSAPKIILIYDFLDWQKPVFVHTPLLRNPDKSKLSKRQGQTDVSWYQEQGYLPEAILNFLALLGWSHPKEKTIFSLTEFIKYFDLKDLSPVGPVVDLKKLDYINGVYIRKTDDKKLIQLIKEYLKLKSFSLLPDKQDSKLKKAIPLIKQRISKLSEIPNLISFFLKEPTYHQNLFKSKKAKEYLSLILVSLEKINLWQKQNIYLAVKQVFKQSKADKKEFFQTLYLAIEGTVSGLPVFESMEILGREKSLQRIKSALNIFLL